MDTLAQITEKEREFYGKDLILLEGTITEFLSCVDMMRKYQKETAGWDPVVSCSGRVKSAASMREKLIQRGLETTRENALQKVYDAAGVRLICPLVEDVLRMAALIRTIPKVTVREEKDYISRPKANGYRSYHMILRFPLRFLGTADPETFPWLEVQLRTIAMDCWASIEHQLKYKKEIPHAQLMRQELKRCSDEIASADLSLSTLKELIGRGDERKEPEI